MIILCGKTATGKNTIMEELVKLGMEQVVTYTTRPMRNGEENGREYWFLPEVHFKTLENEGFFLETTSYNVANGQTWYYGTPIDALADNKAIIMNPDGVKIIKEHKELNPYIFYINVEEDVQMERLTKRGDNIEEANRRIQADNNDFDGIEKYIDLEIINSNCDPKDAANFIYETYQNMIGGN